MVVMVDMHQQSIEVLDNISNPGAGEGTYIGEGGFLGNDGNASPVGYDVYGFDYGTNKKSRSIRTRWLSPHHLGNKSSIPINRCR